MTDLTSPLVSIVTPSFNQTHYLESTLRSVLEQEYPNIEYIVVDGGSSDGSVETIRRYADRLAWWVSEKDRGQTDAINKGFGHANDTYERNAVSEAVAFLQGHPEVGLVYGDANFIDEDGSVIGRFPAAQTSYRLLRQGYVHIPQQSSFWRADLWRRVGPLDPSFYFAMDYDLWVRLAALAPVQYLPRIWANFRLHSQGKTIVADARCWDEMLKVHYRDGGTWFGVLPAKYVIRKVIAPLINWRRKAKFLAGRSW
jgi:glycosyltransferase involved in cell wall biosynthesis